MARKRGKGEGSVYQRKEDGRWIGSAPGGYDRNGVRKRLVVSATTEAEAGKKLDRLLGQVARGKRASEVDPRMTVRRFAEKWLEQLETKVRPKTLITDKGAVEKWIVPTIGTRRLSALTPDDLRAVTIALRKAGRSSSTARRYHGVLLRMLKAASLDGHDIAPRLFLVDKPEEAVNDRDSIPLPDTLRLIAEATSRNDLQWPIAFLQGLRQGERLGLTRGAVKLWRTETGVAAGTITVEWQLQRLPYRVARDRKSGFVIPDGYDAKPLHGAFHLVRPKTRKGFRVMPLVPWAAEALERILTDLPEGDDVLLFGDEKGRPISTQRDTATWQALQEAVNVKHPTGRLYKGHEIRHTTATLLLELKVPESIRIAILGHSSIAVTRGYEHVDTREMQAALEQVAGRLELSA
jgi:integrase